MGDQVNLMYTHSEWRRSKVAPFEVWLKNRIKNVKRRSEESTFSHMREKNAIRYQELRVIYNEMKRRGVI